MADLPALRQAARTILAAAIQAGDARRLTAEALRLSGDRLGVGELAIDLDDVQRVLVVGAGKASGAMAEAVEAALGERVAEGLVVVKESRGVRTSRVRVVAGGHPLPDERGHRAAQEILRLATEAGPRDVLLCLISGGGSALAPLPVEGLGLGDKQAVSRVLLESGATIGELNAVRKHLSRIKGGQLARAAQPARVVSLLLSDVIGDPLDVIASGPTAPDPTTFGEALAVVDRLGVRAGMPLAALAYLEAGARGERPETPKPGDGLFARVTHRVIGNNDLVVEAAILSARRLGFTPLCLTRRFQGEAREAARVFAAVLDEVRRAGRPVFPPACVIAAGETTVTVRGPGRGGRCQEFCLALVEGASTMPGTVVLAAGTDGTDGPTDAAGAIVDPATLGRARERGLAPRTALGRNDAYPFFEALGDLVVTGPTGTNLMDLYLGLVSPSPP